MIFYLCNLNLELSGGLKNRGCEIKFSYMKVSLVEPVETSKTTFRYNEQPLGKTFRGKVVSGPKRILCILCFHGLGACAKDVHPFPVFFTPLPPCPLSIHSRLTLGWSLGPKVLSLVLSRDSTKLKSTHINPALASPAKLKADIGLSV